MHLPHRTLGNVNQSHCPTELPRNGPNIFDFNNVKMLLGY